MASKRLVICTTDDRVLFSGVSRQDGAEAEITDARVLASGVTEKQSEREFGETSPTSMPPPGEVDDAAPTLMPPPMSASGAFPIKLTLAESGGRMGLSALWNLEDEDNEEFPTALYELRS